MGTHHDVHTQGTSGISGISGIRIRDGAPDPSHGVYQVLSGSLPDLPDSTQAAVAVAVTRTSDLSAAAAAAAAVMAAAAEIAVTILVSRSGVGSAWRSS